MAERGMTQLRFTFLLICSCEISNQEGSALLSETFHTLVCMHSGIHFPRQTLIHPLSFGFLTRLLFLSNLPLHTATSSPLSLACMLQGHTGGYLLSLHWPIQTANQWGQVSVNER